ncbi:MAG: bifunctional oligoribonuclease/PAP phosphatase NrnA [Ignavibacteriaceae bacterium]|nr:bifunctional oligoribonuclease/PAP phosphatase NrnA [Ignavibacteriaceae bacterium]
MIDFQKLADIIKANNTFLITTHVNPDADAIGSEVAFYKMLKILGKKSKIINHSATPYNLKFLDTENIIEKFDEALHKNLFNSSDILVALDFNRSDRLVSMQKAFLESKQLKICIDHHLDPEDFVDNQFIGIDYAATGHIIYEFVKKTNIVDINKDIAIPLYAAIMTDTGSFRFERTTASIHRIIADLLEKGANPTEIYDLLYDESKLSKIKLLGRCLSSLKLIADNKAGYMVLTQKDFNKLGAIESDTENFVNFLLSIEGVRLGMLFIELKHGFKVSFRSKGQIPVSRLAGEFGGGGHLNAAGARLRARDMNSMIPKILEKAENYYNKYSEG